MTLRAAAEQALDTLEHVQAHIGRYDPPVVTTIARAMQPTIDALRSALAAEQPQSEPVSGGYIDPGNVARRARGIERVHEIMGEFVEQDGDGLICPKQPFSWETVAGIAMSYLGWHLAGPNPAPPPSAPEPSEAELPPLPIGEAEVVWHEPDPVMPERPGKIIDASIAFFDAAPLGTHLYTAEQMRAYALRAAAAARNTNPA